MLGAVLVFAAVLLALLFYAHRVLPPRASDATLLDDPPPRRHFPFRFLLRDQQSNKVSATGADIELEDAPPRGRFGLVTQSEFRRSPAYAEEERRATAVDDAESVDGASLGSVRTEQSRARRWFGTWPRFHAYLG